MTARPPEFIGVDWAIEAQRRAAQERREERLRRARKRRVDRFALYAQLIILAAVLALAIAFRLGIHP